MRTCHILSNVNVDMVKDREPTSRLAKQAQAILSLTHANAIVYDCRLCDPTQAINYNAYNGTDGWRFDFCQRFKQILETDTQDGDVVVLTDSWHRQIIDRPVMDNKINGRYILEMWVNDNGGNTNLRIFSSEFARNVAVASSGSLLQKPTWITVYPMVEINENNLEPFYTPDPNTPLDVEFMRQMAAGIPVIAPDWGAWTEVIEHTKNGLLYRTPKGKKKCEQYVAQLDKTEILLHNTPMMNSSIAKLSTYMRDVCSNT